MPYRESNSTEDRLTKCESYIDSLYEIKDEIRTLQVRTIVACAISISLLLVFLIIGFSTYKESLEDNEGQIKELREYVNKLEYSIPLQKVRCRLEVKE